MNNLYEVIGYIVEDEFFCLSCSNDEIQDIGKPVLYNDSELTEDVCYKCKKEVSHLYELLPSEYEPSDEEMDEVRRKRRKL